MTINEKLGIEMRVERLRARMTLEDVAEKMGVRSKNTVSRMELGKTDITLEMLINYCDAVGCSWKAILERI